MQHHQLHKQVKAVQVSCDLHSLWLWNMDPACWLWRKRIEAFETKCLRKLLCIFYLEHKTNDRVQSKINFLAGLQEPLLATVKRWKRPWFGHVTRHDSLFKTILQDTLEGGWRCGRQRKCWMVNIKEQTSLPMPDLLTRAPCRKDWKRISGESCHIPVMIQSVKGLNWNEQIMVLIHVLMRSKNSYRLFFESFP